MYSDLEDVKRQQALQEAEFHRYQSCMMDGSGPRPLIVYSIYRNWSIVYKRIEYLIPNIEAPHFVTLSYPDNCSQVGWISQEGWDSVQGASSIRRFSGPSAYYGPASAGVLPLTGWNGKDFFEFQDKSRVRSTKLECFDTQGVVLPTNRKDWHLNPCLRSGATHCENPN